MIPPAKHPLAGKWKLLNLCQQHFAWDAGTQPKVAKSSYEGEPIFNSRVRPDFPLCLFALAEFSRERFMKGGLEVSFLPDCAFENRTQQLALLPHAPPGKFPASDAGQPIMFRPVLRSPADELSSRILVRSVSCRERVSLAFRSYCSDVIRPSSLSSYMASSRI